MDEEELSSEYSTPEYQAMYDEARGKLDKAIREFVETIEHGEYVDSWVLVTHKLSPGMEAAGMSAVSTTVNHDITFVQRRGLLEVALDRERLSGTIVK